MAKISNLFNTPRMARAPKTKLGNAGYDNQRENIDPHIKTQVVDTKEILVNGADPILWEVSGDLLSPKTSGFGIAVEGFSTFGTEDTNYIFRIVGDETSLRFLETLGLSEFGGYIKYDGDVNDFIIGTINNSIEIPAIKIDNNSNDVLIYGDVTASNANLDGGWLEDVSHINRTTGQSTQFFYDTVVADNANGHAVYIRRDAPEGNDYIGFMVDQYRQGKIITSKNLQCDVGNNMWFRALSGTVSFTASSNQYFDCGGYFYFRDYDNSYAVKATISSLNGNITTVGKITADGDIQGSYKSSDGTAGITKTETGVTDFDITIKDGIITSFTKN